MQPNYDNAKKTNAINQDKKRVSKFMLMHDTDQPVSSGKSYFARERAATDELRDKKKNESMIMQDIFGALNY